MMKKLLASCLAGSLLVTSFAYAAPTVELKDAENNVIKVITSAKKGEAISVLITNPGYEKAEVFDNGDAVSYYIKTVADKDDFSIDVPMYDTLSLGGGEYEVTVSKKDGFESSKFKFYFTEEKERVIELLNDEEIETYIEKAYETYSLADSLVFETTDKQILADILSDIAPFESDVQKMYDILSDALCLAAYKDGNENLIADGKISFADTLGVFETPLYEDYLENLSDEGVEKVNTGLLGGDYKKISDIKEKFDDLVLTNLICNYKYNGFGHVQEFLSKYKKEYKDAGIDADKISKSKKENEICQAMQTSDAKNLSDLKKIAASKLKSSSDEGSSGGGGGGGGGGFTTEKPSGEVVGAVIGGVGEDGGYVPNLTTPFADLGGFEWAEESVSNLYRIGAINGKSEKNFAPSDTVTRAEFAKILISAFFGTPADTEKIFSDTEGWAVPYVTYGVKNGIINGISEIFFAPNENVTREQAASIVARALAKKGYTYDKKGKGFFDSDDISDWAKESVEMLSGAKIISGRGSNMFCPKDNMTRAEAAKIIYSAMKLAEGEK